jgi:ketosteroid isomerase-like protein
MSESICLIPVLTQGNVEIVRRAYEAIHARDVDRLKTMTTPDLVLRASPATDGKVHHGPEGIGEVFQAIRDRWQEFRVQALEFYDAGNRVLVLGTILTKGKNEDGIASTAGQVWTLEDGKVASVEAFLDTESAIRAAGLTRLLT